MKIFDNIQQTVKVD